MSDNTQSSERKTRTPPKHKIVRVEDDTGRGAFYWSPTLASAKAAHVETITARNATPEEIIEIGRRGLAVIGLNTDTESSPQLDAFDGFTQE